MKYTKTEAINAIQRNAKIYKDKLANTSLQQSSGKLTPLGVGWIAYIYLCVCKY